MISKFSQLNFSKNLEKFFISFYKNNLICLSAENASNGFYIGKMIIDLDDSKKGISHTLIRNYLLNVRKKNMIQVNNQYVLQQTQLQSQYDKIFSSSIKYIQNELTTPDQILNQNDGLNSACLVLIEDGTVKFLTDEQSVQDLENQKKKVALIGKVINVQGMDILNELKYQNSIVLRNFVPYKQILLNKLLLLLSGFVGLSIIFDLTTYDRKKNLLNPLIKNDEQYKYIFQIQQKNQN
ncbi:transmembrane protein, putative (macronuclear) [Tetrahymena thermophila SB210]|uniref:Transmembrane protein, putative n=1 Tax=Tetrahymena thermophila (strain SB210) TaxID=312017 RepID=I7MJ38_TETTS|nr:transmembrane protein, putative [Tetrahymena thermophila SB210]EAS05036.1 transmembrane protein, putative [Tetrahymena thermophila SB210]|eukprot:XP_001025281.1 transmembrane protein, putative [Tetrahymena thermophila SB210]